MSVAVALNAERDLSTCLATVIRLMARRRECGEVLLVSRSFVPLLHHFALVSGVVRQSELEQMAETKTMLCLCDALAQLPSRASGRYLVCRGWGDRVLVQQLVHQDCEAVVVPASFPLRHQLKLRQALGGTGIVIVRAEDGSPSRRPVGPPSAAGGRLDVSRDVDSAQSDGPPA